MKLAAIRVARPPFDDNSVQTANVAVRKNNCRFNLHVQGKTTLHLRHESFRDETAEREPLTSEGGKRQQSFTQAAPNELKPGEGG